MEMCKQSGVGVWSALSRRAAAMTIAAVAALAPVSLARQGAAEPEKKPEVQTLFVGERGVCHDLFVSEKDAALLRALEMLPARLRELRMQVPDLQNIPDEALDLLINIVSHPMRVAVTDKGFDEKTGMPGFGAVVSFKMSDRGEAEAKEMHQQIETLRGMSRMPFEPAPSKRFPGMTDLPLPMGVLAYGPRQAADGWRYEMIFAVIDDPDAPFKALPAMPAGVNPVVRGSIDLAAWSPMISMFAGFAAMASPQGQQVLDRFREAGLIGKDAIKVEWTLGHSADAMQGTMAVRRLGKHASGMMKGTISAEDLSVIPADASFVKIAKFDLKSQWAGMRKQFEQLGGGEFENGLEQLKAALGFDPETEVIAALGDTAAMFFADSTGGGSALSGVLLWSLAEPEKVLGAMDKAAAKANEFFAQEVESPAAIEVARFERDGIKYTQLRFPGLPVPIEPTIAVAGKWMVIGATPQAATAAARHILSAKSGGGILSNKAFTSSRWKLPGDAGPSVIHFVDSSRTVRDGYASLTFLSSAIANAARTRKGAAEPREPGMVLPLYADLVKDTRPMMMVSYWSGDDFITDLRGDRSILATLSTLLGIGDVMPFLGGAAVGGAIGAKAGEKARERGQSFDEEDEEQSENEDMEHTDEEPEPAKEKTPY